MIGLKALQKYLRSKPQKKSVTSDGSEFQIQKEKQANNIQFGYMLSECPGRSLREFRYRDFGFGYEDLPPPSERDRHLDYMCSQGLGADNRLLLWALELEKEIREDVFTKTNNDALAKTNNTTPKSAANTASTNKVYPKLT